LAPLTDARRASRPEPEPFGRAKYTPPGLVWIAADPNASKLPTV
jgi:hypothetical protein